MNGSALQSESRLDATNVPDHCNADNGDSLPAEFARIM